MRNEPDAREIFLREFVAELILHSAKKIRHARMYSGKPVVFETGKTNLPVPVQKPKQTVPVLPAAEKPKEKKEIPAPKPASPPIQQPAAPQAMQQMVPSIMHEQPVPVHMMPSVPQPPRIGAAPPMIQQIPTVNIAVTPQNLKLLGFEKLMQYILDPSILSIECPGPDRQIIINRMNSTEAVNVRLNADEITAIMKSISDKTRIPLISGVFKVAFGNFVITAVLSEFVGTRFLLQRRPAAPRPMQQPPVLRRQ